MERCTDYGFIENGNCVEQCSNEHPFFNEELECIESCSYEWTDSQCLYTCRNIGKNLQKTICLSSGECLWRTCVNDCPNLIENENCVSECSSTNPFIDGNECTDNCPYFIDGKDKKTCMKKCELPKFINIPDKTKNIKYCVDACPVEKKYIFGNNHCREKCESGQIEIEEDEIISCVDERELDEFVELNKNKIRYVKSCEKPYPYKQEYFCVDKCYAGTFAYNFECLENCPDEAPLIENRKCVSKCSKDFPFKDGIECLDMCPSGKKYKIDNKCIDDCSRTNKQFSYYTKCVEKCPFGTSPNNFKCIEKFNISFLFIVLLALLSIISLIGAFACFYYSKRKKNVNQTTQDRKLENEDNNDEEIDTENPKDQIMLDNVNSVKPDLLIFPKTDLDSDTDSISSSKSKKKQKPLISDM